MSLGGKIRGERRRALFAVALTGISIFVSGCSGMYGTVGGADVTDTYRSPEDIARHLGDCQGGWYSWYGNRLESGFVIGQWKTIDSIDQKLEVFPGFDRNDPRFLDSEGVPVPAQHASASARGRRGTIHDDDYFIMYDETVYGQSGNSIGASPGPRRASYLAILRGVNIFDHDSDRGALVVEYLAGCYPDRYPFNGEPKTLPFFGIFFRVLGRDTRQMANPIKLADRLNNRPYYTETEDLDAAFLQSAVENAVEFVDWALEPPLNFEGCRR
jgi:hypothetical protein